MAYRYCCERGRKSRRCRLEGLLRSFSPNSELLFKHIVSWIKSQNKLLLFVFFLLVVWMMKDHSIPSELGEEDFFLNGGFTKPSSNGSLITFERVGAVRHQPQHKWPLEIQGTAVALTSFGKIALVSNEQSISGQPKSETVINMFVQERRRGWVFRETVFRCPTEFPFIHFKVSGNGNTIVAGCAGYGKHSLVRILHFQEKELTWSLDPFSFQDLGSRVDISHDGRAIVIGWPLDKGMVHVVQSASKIRNSSWHHAELIPSDLEDYQRFGLSVAISGDGNTVGATVILASYRTAVALVFHRTNFGTWQQVGPWLGRNAPTTSLYPHISLALSSNGRMLALAGGRPANSSDPIVQIFDRTIAGEWYENGSLLPNDRVGYGKFGAVMSASESGDVILACGLSDNKGKGACWVFARPNQTSQFRQQGPKYQAIQNEPCGYPCLKARFGQSANMLADASGFIIGGLEYPGECNHAYISGCFGGGAIIYRHSTGPD